MTNTIKNILFDLDGTLTDPKEGIVNSILYALSKLGIEEEHVSELDGFIGPPLRESFMLRYNLSDHLGDEAMRLYREYYSVSGLYENILYPGVAELLESLSASNYKLYLATSKPTVYAAMVLAHFKIDRYFKEITGSNLDNTRTDKTEIIAYILSTYNLQAHQSVMIGDRKHDLIGAKNNSVMTIGVTYGYGSLHEHLSEKPDRIVNSCLELKSLFVK